MNASTSLDVAQAAAPPAPPPLAACGLRLADGSGEPGQQSAVPALPAQALTLWDISVTDILAEPAASAVPSIPDCGGRLDAQSEICSPKSEMQAAALLTEPAPAGIPPELLNDEAGATPDLASMVAEMTALKHEVKLQARTFRKLQEMLQGFVGTGEATVEPAWLQRLNSFVCGAIGAGFQQGIEDAVAVLDASRRQAGGEMAEAREEGFLQAAAALMDARDKLAFGIREARKILQRLPPWRAWLGGSEVLEAALKGQDLALARMDDALRNMELEPLACVGMAFDPQTMRAVETGLSAGQPPGTVLDIIRQGYVRHGVALRVAEVRTAAEK